MLSMKTKLKYTLITLLLLVQFSCNEYLERLPNDGLIREEYWKTGEDVESVLMGAYENFASMDRKLFVFGEIRADMVTGDSNQPRNEELISEGNIYPDNSLSNWQDFYEIINFCNEVITNAPKVMEIDETFSEFEMQGLVSEAYFLRSLSYFYLVRLYKEVPFIDEPSESDDVDFFVGKSTEDEVLNQIVKDLEANRLYAPNNSFSTIEKNKGRASKAAYDALLADIALWQYNYNAVIEYVERIENSESFLLLPGGRWFEIFYPGNTFEGIFEFQFDDNKNQRNDLYALTSYTNNQYDPSQNALELFSFEYATELIRGENASIRKYGEGDFIIWKFIGQSPDGRTFRSSSERNSCNWIVYRFADVLLMKAEALSQLGNYNEALDIINRIRARANVPALSLANNPSSFEDAILEERARELAFEGKRWFDLLRMGRRNNFARKAKLIEIIVSNVPSTQKRILAVKLTNPEGWYLPIYEDEIERNMNLIQNPYYVY